MSKVLLGMFRLPSVTADAPMTIASLVDKQADLQPNAAMIVTADAQISWKSFQKLANQISNLLLSKGVKKGDAVALIMENAILQLACVVGISRIGAVVGLINTHLRSKQLIHCISDVESVVALVDQPGLEAIIDCEQQYRETLGQRADVIYFGVDRKINDSTWLADGDVLLNNVAPIQPVLPEPIAAGCPALYIFTSGTTGLPKAAIVTHKKFINSAGTMAVMAFRARATDRLYNCLPLYHGTGLMVGFGTCLYSGCSMFLRKHFSASNLIREANEHQCNLFIYVGEICRYLLDAPVSERDPYCTLERAVGNGLGAEIWPQLRRRLGLKRVCEFYAASEGNGGFTNVLNKEGSIGVGSHTIKLVDYSSEEATAIRGEDGMLVEAAAGQAGLLLIEVSKKYPFEGYKNTDASNKKLIRNGFAEGDCWFNTGDLIKPLDVGFSFGLTHYQFVDRLGDTYRWKSENISTNEVADILCDYQPIQFAAVYGVLVPGTDGKAGMATIAPVDEVEALDIAALSDYIRSALSRYARPQFIRIKRDLAFTGTYKIVKTALVAEHYDVEKISDPLFYFNSGTDQYEPFLKAHYHRLLAGELLFRTG